MGAVFFHGLGDVLPALLASLALYCGAIVVGAFACLVTLLCYIKHKQGETMVYMEKFPGRTEPIPMLTTWSIHRTLSKEAHRLDVGTHLFQLSAGFSRMYQKHGMLRFYDATHPILAVFKADHIEELLTSNTILKKGHEYDLLGPWLGTGLLTSSGSKWRSRRKLLTPAFHFRILEDFLPAVNEQSKVLVHKLGQLGKGRSCDIVPLVTLCALDIICDTIMGYTINAQSNQHSDYVQAIQVLGHSFTRRIESPLYWIDAIFRLSKPGRLFHQKIGDLHQFTLKVIRERKDELLSCPELQESLEETSLESDIYGVKGKTRKPFLDILLREHIKDPENFTEEDVREEVDTFMFEESQRLYPSVPFITRTCEQDVMIAGRKLPKGADIQVGIYNLHRDPEVFPKPEEFIPDRFLPENVKGRHPFAFVPFSAGPRNCIGQRFAMMEEKVVIANILRNYKLVSLHHRDKIRVMAELVLRPKSGLHVNFIPREPTKLK
ncbi:cytochrome P450 4c3-like isoform X2 [Dermacentor andersoni]|uniref:cytochrome P450 4c3-like isoform X2 n=1 Tax=Dermacentor andersoni TaxID=34620 RepID=UPI0024173549|nr:cytochrome P450 4c3-like isoform X2 [Dermacentor andersoni]